MTRRQRSSAMRAKSPSSASPALLTRISTGPKASSTCPTAASTDAESVTSSCVATASPPAASMAATVAFAPSASLRQPTATRWPCAASATDEAAPMPRDAPVTSATRLVMLPHRSSALAQDMPAPMPQASTVVPSSRRPSSAASLSAIGIEPADVLPYRSMFTTTLSIGTPSRCAAASMMRRLAWCGTNTSTSSGGRAGPLERSGAGVDDAARGAAEHLAPVHVHEGLTVR